MKECILFPVLSGAKCACPFSAVVVGVGLRYIPGDLPLDVHGSTCTSVHKTAFTALYCVHGTDYRLCTWDKL